LIDWRQEATCQLSLLLRAVTLHCDLQIISALDFFRKMSIKMPVKVPINVDIDDMVDDMVDYIYPSRI
jgi:hypothetical protein